MSFTTKPLGLPGSLAQGAMPLRTCSKCDRERVPEGGIQMNAHRWICAQCWNRRTSAWGPRKVSA